MPASDAADAASLTVTAMGPFGPEPGICVVFHDANGNVVATGTTGASGQVTQAIASDERDGGAGDGRALFRK